MHCFFAFFWVMLVTMSRNNMALDENDISSISYDLHKLKATCEVENCTNHFKEQKESLSSQPCHCGAQCIQLDTCCIDSPYADVKKPKLKPVCQSVYKGGNYFIVNQCDSTYSVWANLCHEEWNGDDDLQKLVPVTSLLTSITYKNFYCFRCYEAGDEFLYWRIKLESDFEGYNTSGDGPKLSDKEPSITYDEYADTWIAYYNDDTARFPVNFSLVTPKEIDKVAHECLLDLISDCSDEWLDDSNDEIYNVRHKCKGYMAIREVKRNDISLKYKNMHCALCNFENITDVHCKESQYTILDLGRKPTFSFAHLLDINRSDGELVGKLQRCSSDQLWDPYTKKCRKLTCALPGHKHSGGKCVQE